MNDQQSVGGIPGWQQAFLRQQGLAAAYLREAQSWFDPLATSLAALCTQADKPLLIAVNGCQGSGKSTLCAYLAGHLLAQHGLRVLALSLDDFYLTRARRAELAVAVHPLLATRGVPGTHDRGLLDDTLAALLSRSRPGTVAVPRFDKAKDDRRPRAEWDTVTGALDLVLLEGWCLGARPQTPAQLARPVNELERQEDPDATWRAYVNDLLATDFLPLYERVDAWVMLQAPAFGSVFRWRLEQEHKLARSTPGQAAGLMDADQVARFIQHYQRLTEHCLATLPGAVDYLYRLDEQRRITASRSPP